LRSYLDFGFTVPPDASPCQAQIPIDLDPIMLTIRRFQNLQFHGLPASQASGFAFVQLKSRRQ
jgi:hypothetical protein